MKFNEKWQKLQDEQWQRYLKNPHGVFSVKETKGAGILGEAIKRNMKGVCLDVGSGALPLPYYMEVADSIRFIGIDPYEGDQLKSYEFIQGYAEVLPFKNNWFDGVVFATSLDHILYPHKAMREARRVLKKNGLLFIWIALVSDKDQKEDFHMSAFTEIEIIKLTEGMKIVEKIKIRNLQKIFIYRKI